MKYFGTDGIRGIVNEDLKIELLMKIGQALSSLNIDKIYIGYDTRNSNYLMLSALVSGLLSKGIEVINVGLISTPALQYFSKQNQTNALMITASHNPYYYNGIKIFVNGEKISKKEEEKIEENIKDYNVDLKVGTYNRSKEALYAYLNYLLQFKENSKYKIALDLANGALIDIVNELFKNDNNITIINNKSNGTNINDNCGSLHIDKSELKDNDYLFSFDGDGDRILFKDKNRVYDGDLIVYLLAKYYKEKKQLANDKVVLTKNVNLGIIKAFKKSKIKIILSDVGDKNVYDLMIKENCMLGGESSGHIINLKYMTSGDGLLNFLILNKIINEIDINSYLKDVEYYPYININLNVNFPIDILEAIKNKYQRKARINIRKSGTEKTLRVNICSKKEEIINQIVKEINKYEQYKN